MFNYEAMKEAGLKPLGIREAAVDAHGVTRDNIEALVNDCLEGRYSTDILKVNAKALLMRMVDDVFDCGVDVGFTYSVAEYKACLELRQDEEF